MTPHFGNSASSSDSDIGVVQNDVLTRAEFPGVMTPRDISRSRLPLPRTPVHGEPQCFSRRATSLRPRAAQARGFLDTFPTLPFPGN
jgi:hypothetical protein